MTQEPRPTPETCGRCAGTGWCWWDDLGDYEERDPTQLVSHDTRYLCPDCEGKAVIQPPSSPKEFAPMGDHIPPKYAKQLTPEQVERAKWILRRRNEIPEELDSIDLDAQAFQLLREVVGDE